MNKVAIARSFSRAAESYDQAAHLQRRVADQLLQALPLASVDERLNVVDLGTGTGYCLPILAQQLKPARLGALDISTAMLMRAIRRCSNGYPIQGDLERLPFADNSQDWLISSLAVQWLTSVEPFLSEAWRVLKPGCCLLFSTLCVGTLAELRWAWAQVDDRAHVKS